MYSNQRTLLISAFLFIFLHKIDFAFSTNQNCPLYWTSYANVCYRFRWVNLKTWQEAKSWCQAQGGDLLKIENAQERTWVFKAVANLQKSQHAQGNWWIGLNNLDPNSQSWVWDDKSPLDPSVSAGQRLQYSQTDHCGAITGTTRSYLTHKRCYLKYPYICERPRDTVRDLPEVGLTVMSRYIQQLMTNPTLKLKVTELFKERLLNVCVDDCGANSMGIPLTCNAVRGWQQFSPNCYKVHTDKHSYNEAVSMCNRDGGSLVEIDNDNDEIVVHDFARNTKIPMWTALHSVQVGNALTWQWLNGTSLTTNPSLTYWGTRTGLAPGVPRSAWNRTCVWMSQNQQDYHKAWSTDNCNTRKGFVCKKPEGTCLPGWVPHQASCYQFNIRFKKTWPQANSFCRAEGGNLVSVYGPTYTNFVNSYLDELQEAHIDSFWFGATDNNVTGGPWKWSSGGRFNPRYNHWPGNKAPANAANKLDCSYISTADRNGYWRATTHCYQNKAFVCQIPMNKQVHRVTTPRPQYKCDGHWQLYGSNCYQFNDTRLSWLDARASCQGSGADLVAIISGQIQAFLQRRTRGQEYWIGLNDRTQEHRFVWLDQTTTSKFYRWNKGEPNNLGTENCVEMRGTNALWNDRKCSTKLKYICQKVAANFVLPVTVSTTPALPISKKCGLNWEEDPNSNFCYQFFDQQLDWLDAQDVCKKNGGDLASIQSREEQFYIAAKISTMNSIGLWIGANDKAREGSWRWSDHSAFAYFHFAPGEPNDYRHKEDCVAIWVATGNWNDYPCQNRNGFICKKHSNVRTTPKPTQTIVTRPGTTLGCPPSFKALGDDCWKIIRGRLSYDSASRICRYNGAFVASITSRDEQNFVMSQLPKGGGGYWIGLNDKLNQMSFQWTDGSPVTYTNWWIGEPNNYGKTNEDCVQIYLANGGWNDFPCTSSAPGVVCKRPKTIVSATQPPHFQGCTYPAMGYGGYCYLFYQNQMKWQDAQKVCQRKQGNLASINDRFTQAFLAGFLLYRGDFFWNGLSDTVTQGTYKWVSGTPVTYSNWDITHTGNEISSCVAMTTHHPVGLWTNKNCTERHKFICQTNRQGYTQPVITLPQAALPCPDGWTGHGSYCYKFYINANHSYWLSFDASRDFCRGLGGDLVSIHSTDEYAFVKGLLSATTTSFSFVWMGLNDRDRERSHVWTDGSATDFTAWNPGEPNDYAGREDCATLTRGNWNDLNCYFANPWICKVAKGVKLSTTPAPPTAQASAACGPGWVQWKTNCYFMGNGTALNWYDSRTACQAMGAELVSVHSQDEVNLLVSLQAKTPQKDWWIGYNDLEYNRRYVWSDGSLTDFEFWNKNEPNDYGGGESCVGANTWSGGGWYDVNCNEKRAFQCKRPVSGSTQPIKPVPETLISGGCSNSNFKPVPNSNKCFFIVKVKANWTSAVSACQVNYPGSHLASIISLNEQEYLTSLLRGLTTPVWIGLNALYRDRHFQWSDNSLYTFTNWAKGEPNSAPINNQFIRNSGEKCVEMYTDSKHGGTWNDAQCNLLRPYVCEQKRKAGAAVPNTQGSCTAGFTSYGQSCYRYFPPNGAANSWSQANNVCVQNSATLVVIEDRYEDGFVQSLVGKSAPNGYWIGLSDQGVAGTYTWMKSAPVFFTNWGKGEPTKGKGEGCVAITNNVWNDTVCNTQLGFVCEINSNPPPTTPGPQAGAYCNPGQTQIHGFCFYISRFQVRTWPAASYLCNTMGMELASFHSLSEMQTIWQIFKNLKPMQNESAPHAAVNIWIGMNKGLSDGFAWKDGSPVSFLNWAPNEPSDPLQSKREECVEMYTSNGQWNDVTCFTARRFVCKKAANQITTGFVPPSVSIGAGQPVGPVGPGQPVGPVSPVGPGQTPPFIIPTVSLRPLGVITQPQGVQSAQQQQAAAPSSTSSNSGLSTGGLIGILIAIIALMGLFAFGVIFLKRRNPPMSAGVGGFENAMYSSSSGAVNIKNDGRSGFGSGEDDA